MHVQAKHQLKGSKIKVGEYIPHFFFIVFELPESHPVHLFFLLTTNSFCDIIVFDN